MKSSMLPFKRGLWVSGRKVSKLFFLLFLSCLFAFNSCTNIFETSVEETTEEHQEQPAAGQTPAPIVTQPSAVKVSFSGSLSMRGAVPSQIDQAVANQNTQELETSYQEELEASLSILQRLARAVRSASPSVAAGGNYEFFVRAFTNDGAEPQEVTPTQDASGQYTYAFLLEPGHIWYFTAGFRRNAIGIQGQTGYEPERILMLDLDSQRNAPFYHDFTNMDDLSSQHTFILGPVQSEEGKGSLNLELTVDTSKVDNFKLFIPDATDGHPVEWNADGKVHITEDGTTAGKWYIKSDGLDSESHNVPSGTYNLSIIFYKQFIPTGGSAADAYNTPVYISYQTINVFDNMTTNLWMNENDDSSSASTAINKTTHAFNVSQTLVENFTNTSLYVGRPVQSNITPNDEAVGGPFSPLATLEQAFNLIEARGRGAPYRIYVSGTQEGSFTVPAAITSAMASSIEITTASGNPQATLDAATTGGSVLTVNSAVPLKISNLKITGGNAGSGNGGGINIPSTNTSARVTLDTGALITGNSAAHGDGVYVGGGSLILQGAPKVEEDDDICLAAGKTITAKQLTGSEHIANITQENWIRHSTIITGSSLSNSVANRFNLTANADDEWQKIAAPNQITIYAPIYVGSGGDDSAENSGTKTHPFESFTRACGEMNDATKNWDININGTVNGAQTIAAAVSSGAASITIQGVSALSGGNPQDKIDAGSNGSALTIATSVPVTIKKLLITGGNKSGDGGGINVTAANAELYLANDVQIYGNEATGNGGGINLGGTGAKLFMYSNSLIGEPGISITSSQQAAEAGSFGNKAANGGGIYIGGSGAAAYIGATGLASNGDVVPEVTNGVFCKIYRNYSTNGGGIYNAAGIVKLCNKLNINYNRASDSGGGLYIGAGASESKSEGGSLYKNAAVNGGGLYICDGAAFTLDGGIGGNGSSYYNTATNGGAVYNAGTFKLESNAFLCYGYSAGTNDVYLANVGGVQKTITLLAANYSQYGSSSSNIIGVTIPDWKHGRGKQIINAEGDVTISSTFRGKFTTTENGWSLSNESDNKKVKIDAPIYVAGENTRYQCKGSGYSAPSDDESTSGNKYHPFKTLAAACQVMNNKDFDYTVYIDGEIEGGQAIPDTLKSDGKGTYNAKNVDIQGCNNNKSKDVLNAKSNGSSLTVNTTVPVFLSGITVTGGNSTGNGGGINIPVSGAKVNLSDADINGNKAAANGGGLYAGAGATVYLNSSVYIGNINIDSTSDGADIFSTSEKTAAALSTGINIAAKGGGIYNDGQIEFGVILYKSGTTYSSTGGNFYIYGNTASEDGGAVYSNGTLNMSSGSRYIRYNYAVQKGGGIYQGGSLLQTTTGTSSLYVESNKADSGGGIYVAAEKQFDITSGNKIMSNTAVSNGGGFYNAGRINISSVGGDIALNTAVNGGGIYNAASATVDMSKGDIGGSIDINNVATPGYNTATNGGAVYVCVSSKFQMTGTGIIPVDSSLNDHTGKNDVYLQKDGSNEATIYFPGSGYTLSGTAPVATITPAEWKRGTKFLSTSSSSYLTTGFINKFALSKDNLDWDQELDSAASPKFLYITMPIYVASSASDDTTRKRCNPAPATGANGTASKPYATIAAALQNSELADAGNKIKIDGTIGAQSILDVSVTDVTISGYKAAGDTSSSAKIDAGGVSGAGSALTVNKSGITVTIQDLAITGGNANGSGDAANGGGICLSAGTVKLVDGVIISENHADLGAGVYIKNGAALEIAGSTTITSNTATVSGGAIYNAGTLTMSNGTIGGSTTALQNKATNNISGVDAHGGAIYQGGTFNLTGSAKIFPGSENTNDVYLASDTSVVNLTGNIDSNGNSSTAPITLTHGSWNRGKNIVTGSSYINDNYTKFSLTDSEFSIVKYGTSSLSAKLDAPIYVAGSSSVTAGGVTYGAGNTKANGGRGTKAKPYSNIADAVGQCWNGPNDTKTTGSGDNTVTIGREINIVGTIAGAQEIGSSITTSNASAITLTGVSGTTPTLNGGFTDTTHGSTLTLATPLPVTIKSLKITGGNSSNTGGGINKTSNADTAILTIADGTVITGNKALSNGGGIYCLGKLIMTGGEVSANNAGTIADDNTASGYGGGINAGTFELYAGEIKQNTVAAGGGGVSTNDMKMTDGTISANEVTTTSIDDGFGGGGVFIWDNSTFTMGGGQISGNKAAKNGGGVALKNANFYMYGSAVIGDSSAEECAEDEDNCSNYAGAFGGGIYAMGDSVAGIGFSDEYNFNHNNYDFSFSGSGLYYNYAAGDGGAIYICNKPLKMGAGKIKYNTAQNGGGIYAGNGFTMVGGLIADNYAADTTDDTCGGGGVYSRGDVSMKGLSNNSNYPYIKNNVAEKNGGGLYITYEGNLYLGEKASIGTDTGSNYAKSEATAHMNYAKGNGGGVYISGSGGGYLGYASADNKANETLATSDCYICYNYADGDGGGIYNASDKPVEILKGKVQYNSAANGGGIYSKTKNINIISGGSVYYNHASNNGGGIYTCATVDMNGGGTINKNSADNNGGGVCLDYDTTLATAPKIYMTGTALIGDVSDGVAKSGAANCANYAKNGGGIWGNNAHVIMGYNSSGEQVDTNSKNRLRKNFATGSGGGIYLTGTSPNICELKMKYAKVDYNAVDNGEENQCMGAGIYVSRCNVLIESGSSISYNEANYDKGYGGGIWYSSTSTGPTFSMTGGDIISNKAYSGGGLYQDSNKVTMQIAGSSWIKDNQVKSIGGGIYNRGNVSLAGSIQIVGNSSTDERKGGAVVIIGGCKLILGDSVNISSNGTRGSNDILLGNGGPELQLGGTLNGISNNKKAYLSFNSYNTNPTYVTGQLSGNYTKFGVIQPNPSNGKTWTLGSDGKLVAN